MICDLNTTKFITLLSTEAKKVFILNRVHDDEVEKQTIFEDFLQANEICVEVDGPDVIYFVSDLKQTKPDF